MVEVGGWAGLGALVTAYALLTAGQVQATSQVYVVAGSAGLAVNGAAHSAWPSVVLNLILLAIAVHALQAGPPAHEPSHMTRPPHGVRLPGGTVRRRAWRRHRRVHPGAREKPDAALSQAAVDADQLAGDVPVGRGPEE